ncbi:MAG: LacI family transcriptional regulator [Chloroflexi bacterium]|nr:LacI family transcriptional regulator [Chloroflexota bacterium]
MIIRRSKLKDVAELAGVSISTASRVLNNKPNVLPETRERVLMAAERLAYYHAARSSPEVPVAQATIGVLSTSTPDRSAISSSFYSNIMAGIDEECREQQIKLVFASFSRAVHSAPAAWPLPLHDPDIDGLILTGAIPTHIIDQIRIQTGKPIVLVDAYASACDMVLADNVMGGYQAVRHLIEQGHRHIGLIGTQPGAFPSFMQRREGYLRALADYGIAETYIGESSHLMDATYDATQALLRRHPQITAIFFCLDLVANHVIQAVRDLGREVPEDVSVVGFDDLPLAEETMPPLTTMHVDIPLMGRLGVRQLIERLKHPERVTTKVLLRPQLVIRDTVKSLTSA